MEWESYADSKTYFDLIAPAELSRCGFFRSRWLALKMAGGLLLCLPLGLFHKIYKTLLRAIGCLASGALLLLTLGISSPTRELFLRRVASLTKDLTDWVFLPFAVLGSLARLSLASLIYPTFFLRF